VVHDALRDALGHYLAGQAWDQLAEALAHNYLTLLTSGARELVDFYVSAIPVEKARADPRVCFVGGFAAALAGDQARSRAWLAAGRASKTDRALIDGIHDWDTLETFLRGCIPFDDLGAALSACIEARDRLPPESPLAPVVSVAGGTWLCLRGELEGPIAWLQDADELTKRLPTDVAATLVPASYALALLAKGEAEAARRYVARAEQARAASTYANDPNSLDAVIAGAQLRVHDGQAEQAIELCQTGLHVARGWTDTHFVIPRLLIEQARAYATLGRFEEADACLEDADRRLHGAPDPGVIPMWLEEVRAMLPAPARAPAIRPALDRDELSQRELEVLRLLAGPLSPREIASELFVSTNTLKSHIKSVYRKLGVDSRAAAVARARALSLVG
jgi:LuxR family maltose regulon positive regulatory protein